MFSEMSESVDGVTEIVHNGYGVRIALLRHRKGWELIPCIICILELLHGRS